MAYHVSKARFGELVEQALAELPEPFSTHLEEMTIEIKDRPSARQLRAVSLDADDLLFGLFEGVPLTERSVEQSGRMPAGITLFQEDHEIAFDSEAELVREIRKTVLHEIGHYFGMDEDDLDALGYG